MKKPDPRLEMKTLLESKFTPAQAQAGYEHRIVSHILKRCSAKPLLGTLKRLHHERYGTYEVGMEFFLDRFDNFPLHLIADSMEGIKLHRERAASFGRTFVAFEETPFAKCYKRHAKKYDGELPLVVVFPRDTIQLGLVIHAGLPNVKERTGTQIRFRNPQGNELFVESFAGLLAAIYDAGNGWRPQLN